MEKSYNIYEEVIWNFKEYLLVVGGQVKGKNAAVEEGD